MAKKKDYARGWQQKARAQYARPLEGATGPIDLGDGCEFIGRRIDLRAWVLGGKLPQSLTEQFIRMEKGVQDTVDDSALSAEDAVAAYHFMRRVVVAAVAEPKIVDLEAENRELKDDEVSFGEIFGAFPSWVDKIMNWVRVGQPGIPVQMTNGEVTTVKTVETFRDGERGEADAGAGPHVPQLRDTAERSDRAA